MPRRVLKDPEDLELWIAFLRTRKFPQTVTASDGRDRSYEQNNTQWLWATEAAQQYGDRTAADVQREWKLHHGVPLLREDSEAFREKYDKHIKPLPYHEKLAFMDMIDVTSALKVKQMTTFLDTVQRECLQNGLRLTDPEGR